ncbi:MAG TPA: serine hydrolase domain-containing protein [Nitriliruptorales bacterium]
MINGYVHPHFAPLAVRFDKLFGKPKDGGGSISAYLNGELVLDVWTGYADPQTRRPWERDTMALSFSTTKGVISTLLHRLVEQGLLTWDDRVADHWPDFAAAGKEGVTIRHVLTHTAGLHAVRPLVSEVEELLDHRHMATLLAKAAPRPEPGAAPGYHGLTYGWLVAGLIEHVTGRDVRDVLREDLAEPMELDGLFFGAPEDQRGRLARLFPGVTPAGLAIERLALRAERFDRTRSLVEALLVDGFEKIVFDPSNRIYDAAMPAVNGVFTARSLAKLYGALANRGQVGGLRLLQPETVTEIGRVQRRERDYVLGLPMRWRLGYHQAFTLGRRQNYAFGHFGYGGSGAWADPRTGLSLAFVTNRLGNATTPVGDGRLVRLGGQAIKLARGT